MKQLLITGSFGFVGSHLSAHFLRKGLQVQLLDIPNHPRKAEVLAWLHQLGSPKLIESDICDQQSVLEAVQNCDEVIHCAALLNSTAPLSLFRRINVEGTRTVCTACLHAGVKHLTLISTSDVFGIPVQGEVLTEESPYSPWSEPYADTKIEAAEYVRSLRNRGELNVSIVYPGWVYGPGDRQFFTAVTDMVKDGLVFTWHRKQPMQIYFVYIDDLVCGVDTIITSQVSHNRDYLLLDPNSGITPLDLFNTIAAYGGHSIKHIHVPYPLMMLVAKASQTCAQYKIINAPLLTTTDVKAFGNQFCFSTARAQRELNWEPAMPAAEGIKHALDWQTANL